MFTVDEICEDQPHACAVVTCCCDLADESDALVLHTVGIVRGAYGEDCLLALAEPDPSVGRTFDIEAITRAFRLGLPNPDEEGDKPSSLANYRAEPSELIGQSALGFVYGIEFPRHPQIAKFNSNQPILGFDGWGFLALSGAYALVLVQAKATDEDKRPPGEAEKLAQECRQVPQQLSKICRALSVLAVLLQNQSHYLQAVLGMLECLEQGDLPQMVVAPVVVRGLIGAHIGDLEPIRAAFSEIAPIVGRGVTVSIGADLTQFGREVMYRAREN